MLKLSIIVPIYKVEPFLHKCIDSLLNQDLNSEEYEIILVDDGSPDNCGKIADEYATKISNIRVIHQKNGGLSTARNAGIMTAKGKYIQFVDSDDYLEPNVIGFLVSRAEHNNLDVLRFNYRNVNEKYEEFWPNKTPKQTWGYEESITDGTAFLNERLGFACYAIQFLIRRELLCDCYFKPNIYFEDVEWTPRMLLKARRVSSIPQVIYNYLFRLESITRATDINRIKKKLNDQVSLIEGYLTLSNTVSDSTWFSTMISHISLAVITQATKYFFNERIAFINELKQQNVFPLHICKENKRNWWKLFIINLSPCLYCSILRIKFR